MVQNAIRRLVEYGIRTGLTGETDRIYATNQILDVLKLDEYEEAGEPEERAAAAGECAGAPQGLEEILKELLDYACSQGLIEDSIVYRDLFDTRLMNCLIPRPSEVTGEFWRIYKEQGPRAATDYFYKLSQDSDYIRRYRVRRDQKWVTKTPYGDLDITINLSKPERIPRLLPPPSWRSRAANPNVCCAWRMRAMPDG